MITMRGKTHHQAAEAESEHPVVDLRRMRQTLSEVGKKLTGPTRQKRRMLLLGALVLSVGLSLLGCCARPDRALWPPAPDEPAYRIDVLYGDWHARIVETTVNETGESVFRTYEFAETAWYLENRQGYGGMARALLWPTAGAIGTLHLDSPPWEQEDLQPPIENHWTFYLSERGRSEMVAGINAMRNGTVPGWGEWSNSTRSFHLFFNCNQFVARALRDAGLPVRPTCAIYGPLLRRQLDRALKFQPNADGPRT